MSVESLILLALFVLLPLIERLLLAARRRREKDRAERRETPVPLPPVMVPPAKVPASVAASALPPVPRAAPTLVPATPRPRAPQRPAATTARARAAAPASWSQRDLRRAVVMAAVLGPSRALSPYDGRVSDPRG